MNDDWICPWSGCSDENKILGQGAEPVGSNFDCRFCLTSLGHRIYQSNQSKQLFSFHTPSSFELNGLCSLSFLSLFYNHAKYHSTPKLH